MATVCSSTGPATGCTVTLLLLFMLAYTAQAETGAVSVGNAFQSPTQFTCNSNVMKRQTYTAISNEIYYFVFDTTKHQFWDCQVQNNNYAKSGTFRFWGDDSHGGPQLFSCVNCKWNVDQFGISIYVDNQWQYQYFWRNPGHRKLAL